MAEAGKRGWVVLTKDRRIRYRKLEQDALVNNGAKAFVFIGGAMTGEEMGQVLGKAALAMARRGVSVPAPFIFTIGRSGRLVRIR